MFNGPQEARLAQTVHMEPCGDAHRSPEVDPISNAACNVMEFGRCFRSQTKNCTGLIMRQHTN